MDWDNVAFNGFSCAAGIFLLQYGCDLFVENISILLRRMGISETLIALFSSGAEWEELAVVLASIVQKRPSLGLANVVGSSIANIFGAFALGLLFHSEPMSFDLSGKIYAGLLLIMTSAFTIVGIRDHLNVTGGIFFIVSFGVYVFSIASACYEGFLQAVGEEFDEEEEEAEEQENANRQQTRPMAPPEITISEADNRSIEEQRSQALSIQIFSSTVEARSRSFANERTALIGNQQSRRSVSQSIGDFVRISGRRSYSLERTTLFRSATASKKRLTVPPRDRGYHNTSYYITRAFMGLTLLSFSGYVLVHTSCTLAAMLNISETLFGLTLLSMGTTLPEKFMGIVNIQQEHGNVMVATTSGANTFLLSLCVGVVFMVTDGYGYDLGMALMPFEIWTAFAGSVILWAIVWIGGYKFMGGLMLGLYAGFVGAEFTYYRR